MAQRERKEIVIIDMLQDAEDALHAGQYPAAQRLLRTSINALERYAEERVLIQRVERIGLDAPSVVRSLDEHRRRREANSTA